MAMPARTNIVGLGHDLANALAAIRGRAQATRRRIERVDTLNRDHIAADLGQIEQQADRLAALLLDVSNETNRATTGDGIEFEPTPAARDID